MLQIIKLCHYSKDHLHHKINLRCDNDKGDVETIKISIVQVLGKDSEMLDVNTVDFLMFLASHRLTPRKIYF